MLTFSIFIFQFEPSFVSQLKVYLTFYSFKKLQLLSMSHSANVEKFLGYTFYLFLLFGDENCVKLSLSGQKVYLFCHFYLLIRS